ncbi:methyltransferase domain-containing protein [Paenibacillus sp. 5J-6]|uniref:Methyltransferase domain-containing protein n=1 Tax=Paenibacillus silvestris TaxID=2606219 RepID=A0A6L8UUR1_9BACL|nr:class I SAM-dependent methyltransferase [Paenibacillus silvestris]MZQ81092.1 methyltransferase domain-containing protein [Paenibacillus silvestris]
MQRPQIWHYGLVAQSWANATEAGSEGAYYKKLIETSGQPALDLGCGSGRLLLNFLQAGLDVDGCDYSEDMLAVCQERAAKHGLSPRLYVQAMHELDLPQRYRTIIACGVIGLGGEHRLTMQAMQRCYEHIRSGGTFAFNYAVRWNDPPAWLARLPEYRRAEPQEWPASSERQRLADGMELEMAARTLKTDPLENVSTRQMRVRLWHEENLIKEEVHTQMVEDFTKNELVLMLERAGFSDIQIFGDFRDEPATADHHDLVFICRK